LRTRTSADEQISEDEMKGIQFVVDDTGKKKAVLIDLSEWGELWEDLYDVLVAQSRKDEPTVDWDNLKAEMSAEETKAG
jgi:hypothetical protein